MAVPLGIWHARGIAVALASGAAISLFAVSGGIAPALAEPVTTTTEEVVPTEEAVTEEIPTTVEAPPQIQTTVAPQLPPAPTTQAPVVTEELEVVTTTAEPLPTPTAIVTTTAEPLPTPTAIVTTTAEPLPTAIVTTTAGPLPTATGPLPTPTGPLPTATGPLPTPTGPLPTPTGPLPTPTGPLPTPTGPLPTATGPLPTAIVTTTAGPLPTATGPLPTATGPRPTASAPIPTGTTAATTMAEQEAGGGTQLAEPQALQADPQDLEIAQQAVPVQENPPPAPQAEINRLRDLVIAPANPNANGATSVVAGADVVAAERRVLQWQPDWVQYDEFYRPLIFNPYPEPLQIVYLLAGVPRILLIPPFGRVVTEARDLGSYNFTALRLNAFGIPIDIAVGNFFGGGYLPAPGQPAPAPPPPVRTLTDVPVQVKYTNATYRPIRVQKIVDVGPDPAVGGEHKVLLDGVTPAWGDWKQTETGAQQFEVHKTQSFPGMEAPAEGPLPGDYDLQLVSDSSPTGLSGKDITLIVVAVIVAALGLGAIVLTIVLGRRRRPQH